MNEMTTIYGNSSAQVEKLKFESRPGSLI